LVAGAIRLEYFLAITVPSPLEAALPTIAKLPGSDNCASDPCPGINECQNIIATPTKAPNIPIIFRRVIDSVLISTGANISTKKGKVADKTAVRPEEMYCSPQNTQHIKRNVPAKLRKLQTTSHGS
jgi:hypothetical protein